MCMKLKGKGKLYCGVSCLLRVGPVFVVPLTKTALLVQSASRCTMMLHYVIGVYEFNGV